MPVLLLAYEETGYDNSQPGRLPDLLPHASAKRIVDWGADAVKILIYSPFDDPQVNDIKHAFIERIGAECECFTRFHLFWSSWFTIPRAGNEERPRVRQDHATGGDRKYERVHQGSVQRGRAKRWKCR